MEKYYLGMYHRGHIEKGEVYDLHYKQPNKEHQFDKQYHKRRSVPSGTVLGV